MSEAVGQIVNAMVIPDAGQSDSTSTLRHFASGMATLAMVGHDQSWVDRKFVFDIEFPFEPRHAVVSLSFGRIRNNSHAVNLGFAIKSWSVSYHGKFVRVNGEASIRDVDGAIEALSYFCVATD